MLNNKSILITGGTGSFGKAFLNIVLKKYKKIKKLVIFSRDELKQWDLKNKYPESKYPNLRFFIGDIRDKERTIRAFRGIDYVVHAAALKQIDTAEYNPDEFIKTNVVGSQNVVEASLENNIKKVIALSTDKACSPSTLYGATKLCSERIFLAANNIKGNQKINFSVVRYGNVVGSRGSVVPLLLDMKKNKSKYFNLTHNDATRFWISLDESIEMVLYSIKNINDPIILIPKLKTLLIKDLIKIIYPDCKIKITGLRAGEKVHEDLISLNETNAYDIGKYYCLLAPFAPFNKARINLRKKMNENFFLRSDSKKFILKKDEIVKSVKKINFEV
jgi:UDP-N-acetylglucosamine 4,6-dehydratase/5-epimerase